MPSVKSMADIIPGAVRRTHNLVRSDLAPFPGLALVGFFDQVRLCVVEKRVTPRARHSGVTLSQRHLQLRLA
jgi:hypothetical protein